MPKKRTSSERVGTGTGTGTGTGAVAVAVAPNGEVNRDAKLDAILDGLHALRQLVHRLTVPVEVVSLVEACRRLGRARRTVQMLHARRVFTDGRPPERRVGGADLVFYADEIDVYRSEGERGVKRLREELGRV